MGFLIGLRSRPLLSARRRSEILCIPPARREMAKHGVACDGHRAHQITQKEYDSVDRVYYMDRSNYRYLQRLLKDTEKCFPLLDHDVADPWYTGDFGETWRDIVEGCEKILEEFV